MSSQKIMIAVVFVVIIVGLGVWWWQNSRQPVELDDFAKCLRDKDAKFYGAFWCPHCQSQKKLFGGSQKYLPYVECSTSDSRGQLKTCADAKIEAYPTWQFADNSKLQGELTLQELSKRSGCQLPE